MFLKRERTHSQTLSIIQYQRRDRRAVLTLLERTHYLHTHLDWFETDAWLDTLPPLTWTVWKGARLVAIVGLGEPLSGTSWIRIAAFELEQDIDAILQTLWQHIQPRLTAAKIERTALLAIQDWILPFAQRLGFQPYEQVVTLRRESTALPPLPDENYHIRSYAPHELNTIIHIDQTAFESPWQMSGAEIRQSERLAQNITVALVAGQVVGYQLSTLYFDGAHLARLAVLPDYQGRGIGGALVRDLIHRFARRNVYSITINTQLTNTAALMLYRRLGFERTGYDLAVWMLDNKPTDFAR
jgi:[ribosomal protein S18]-alanine N-acetyltransferase